MDRRSFLKTLLGTAAASTTSYFLPPIGGWHSNYIVGIDPAFIPCEYGQTIITVVDACSLSRSYNRVSEPLNAKMLRDTIARYIKLHEQGIWNDMQRTA
jgi:hypothetical protein